MNLQQLQRTKPTRPNEIRTVSEGTFQWDQARFTWILVEKNPENNEKSRINNSGTPVNTGADEVGAPAQEPITPPVVEEQSASTTLNDTVVSEAMGRVEFADKAKSLGYELDADLLERAFDKYRLAYNPQVNMDEIIKSLIKDEMKALSDAVDKMVEKSEAETKAKVKPVQPEEIKNPPKPWTPEKPVPNPVIEQVTKEMVSTELALPPEETVVQTPEVTPEPPSDPVETPQEAPDEPIVNEVQTGNNSAETPPEPPTTLEKPVPPPVPKSPSPSVKTSTKIQREIQAVRLAKAGVSKK